MKTEEVTADWPHEEEEASN